MVLRVVLADCLEAGGETRLITSGRLCLCSLTMTVIFTESLCWLMAYYTVRNVSISFLCR